MPPYQKTSIEVNNQHFSCNWATRYMPLKKSWLSLLKSRYIVISFAYSSGNPKERTSEPGFLVNP